MKRKEALKLEAKNYDLDFLARVQPQGNFKRHGKYIETGDGFFTCLRIWKYPTKGLAPFWGIPLTIPQEDSSLMAVISVGTENREQIIQQISKSASQQYSNVSSKSTVIENTEASNNYRDLLELTAKITQKNEVMKRLYFRLFVYAPTLEELNQKCKAIIRKNSMFRMARYVDEQLDEYKSIFMPTMLEANMPTGPQGTPIDAENLAGIYPFNHVKLEDPNGSYYGYTRTSGEVMFDPFLRDRRRTRSFFFVTGNAGMGKSTLLKKMSDDVFSRGAIIRNFDVSSEYTEQTRAQGGTVIKLDQSQYRINPFEIFPTVVDDETGAVDEINSFHQNITKLKNFFQFLNEDVTSDDLEVFSTWLVEFYQQHDLWTKNPDKTLTDFRCTGLPREMYPTLEDFIIFANEKQRAEERNPRRHITSSQVTTMNRITSTFGELQETQGSLFDGKTEFPDISKEQVVTFNIQGLLAKGQGVFNAQVYSVLSLLSADIIKNGMAQRKKAAQLGHELDPADVTWYYLNIDEVENIITPRFSFGVEFLASMMEQMRKNLCAITMAAPTIKDLIMNGNTHDPYILAVQKIFSLFQIRFFFQMSDDDLPRLSVALGGSTTVDELEALTSLQRGECLMNINGDRNIRFTVEITGDEIRRYQGGI